jgi:hypothetical protein
MSRRDSKSKPVKRSVKLTVDREARLLSKLQKQSLKAHRDRLAEPIGTIFMLVPIVVVFVSCIVVTPIILLFLPLIFAALALSQQHRGNC